MESSGENNPQGLFFCSALWELMKGVDRRGRGMMKGVIAGGNEGTRNGGLGGCTQKNVHSKLLEVLKHKETGKVCALKKGEKGCLKMFR